MNCSFKVNIKKTINLFRGNADGDVNDEFKSMNNSYIWKQQKINL